MPRQIEVMGQGMVEFPDSMSDDQILSVLNRERMTYMQNYAPGVDKPGLPDSRTLPTPKNFPGFGNPSAEYARRQEPVTRMMDGAARMTRAGADAKFGGASDIMRGAGEIAAPLAAVPLAGAGSIGAGAAMLGRMALGAGGGYAGGQVARSMVPEDQPGLQDFVENAGATAGGLLAGGAAESPKIGAFIKGAAKEAPSAMIRSGPYGMGGLAMHAMGHGKLGLAADAVAAAKGLPSVIRSGMAEAAGKPWLGPVASGILGTNKPKPSPAPNAARQEAQRVRGLMGDAEQAAPTPPIPVQTQTPSGRKPGSIFNQTKEPTPAEIIARDKQQLANIEAFKAKKAAKSEGLMDAPKPTAPSENAAARMAAQDAAGEKRSGLMNDVVAEADSAAANTGAAKKIVQSAANQASKAFNAAGTIGEHLRAVKDTGLSTHAKFFMHNGQPLPRGVPLTAEQYEAVRLDFNQKGYTHPTSNKPWKVKGLGLDYAKPNKDGNTSKFGRHADEGLADFNEYWLKIKD